MSPDNQAPSHELGVAVDCGGRYSKCVFASHFCGLAVCSLYAAKDSIVQIESLCKMFFSSPEQDKGPSPVPLAQVTLKPAKP
jgi:hypothetical protein